MPQVDAVYDWEHIPQLAADYAASRLDAYFPLYEVSPP
jgi:hypothetical protein